MNTHVAVIPDPTRPRLVAASFDVTERRQMVTQLSRFSDLFNSANDMITVIDPTGQILYASPSTERILGYPEHARLVGGILGLVHPDDLKRPNDKLSALIAGTRGREPFTARVLTLRDEVRHVECVGVNLLAEPAVGGVVITAGSGCASSIWTVSKLVNDTAGHAAGDRLIVAVADSITQSIRTTDLAARVGGDEFVIVLDPVAGPEQALRVANRMRQLLMDTAKNSGTACGEHRPCDQPSG